MSKDYEQPRAEYAYWKKSKDIFFQGIDKNEMLPDHIKAELKNLIAHQFQFLGQIIGTQELIYLREKQHP